jgi:hypothetical protein
MTRKDLKIKSEIGQIKAKWVLEKKTSYPPILEVGKV